MRPGTPRAAQVRDYYRGKTALITGAGSGIGAALARALTARGAQVWVTDVDETRAVQVAADITATGAAPGTGAATAARLDVTDGPAFQAVVDDVVDRTGRLDLLFNHAGFGIFGPLRCYTPDDWTRLIAVNLGGVTHGVHAALPHMLERGDGHIVNTASAGAMFTMPLLGGYAATKHAILALGNALRVELAGDGVRVTTLCPGVTDTPFLTGGFPDLLGDPVVSDDRQRGWWARRRPVSPATVARATLDALPGNPRTVVVPRALLPMLAAFRALPGLDERVATQDLRAALGAFPEFATPPTPAPRPDAVGATATSASSIPR